jgi:hypothetical protein
LTPGQRHFQSACIQCAMTGHFMRSGTRVCGPDEVEILQQIFDSVWRHLERIGRAHPDDDHMRQWVSARVIACAKDRDLLDVDAIRIAVLKSLHH